LAEYVSLHHWRSRRGRAAAHVAAVRAAKQRLKAELLTADDVDGRR